MKTKILLSLFLTFVLACLFTFVIGAQEIPEWTEVTILEQMTDKATFGDDGTSAATSRVLMSDGKTYPAYYICKDATTLAISFTDLNKASGITYTANNVVRIEIPIGTVKVSDAMKVANGYTALKTVVIPEGATEILKYGFKARDNGTNSPLVSISLPSTLTVIGEEAFYCCNSLTELVIPEGVTEIPKNMAYCATGLTNIEFPSTLTTIREYAFRSANLSGGVVIPEGVTTIGDYAFKATNVTSVYIPSTITTLGKEVFRECYELTVVNSKSSIIGDYMFYDCRKISTVTLDNIVNINQRALYIAGGQTGSLTSVTIPNGIKTIGDYAFIRQALVEIEVPASVETLGDGVFMECKSLEKAVVLNNQLCKEMFKNCSNLKELVITDKMEKYGSSALNNVSTTFTTYYTGTDYERIKSIFEVSRVKDATFISYQEYILNGLTEDNYNFIYGANLCGVAYDGKHTIPSHEYYFTAFDKESSVKGVCTKCGFEEISETVSPIFTSFGYSSYAGEGGGISIRYKIDYDAIDAYTRITGENIDFGVFVALYEKLGNNELIDLETGKMTEAAFVADMTDSGFDFIKLKIVGFDTDKQKSADFAIGAYVLSSKGAERKIRYIQEGNPVEENKYCYISYESVLEMTSYSTEE